MTSLTKIPISNHHKYAIAAVGTLLLLLTLSLAFPHNAYAAAPWDIGENIQNLIKDMVISSVNTILDLIQKVTNFFDAKAALNTSFDAILTRGHGQSGAYKMVEGMQTAVIVVGQSILAFALLMQLVKISQKVDGSATLPVVKEIALLAVFFVVGSYLVNHSFDICTAAYDEINKLTTAVMKGHDTTSISGFEFSNDTDIDCGGLIIIWLAWIAAFIASLIGSVLALALIMARAIQLYVMAACSPIPFSLMMFEETRQMGIGFCKNFAAVCLAGTILAILIMIYPALVGDILKASAVASDGGKWVITAGSVGQLIPVISCSFMYIYALIKSGSWARDILGG